MPKIAAYRLDTVGDYVIIQRCVNGEYSEATADTFREAIDFLTQPQPDCISIVWDLNKAYKVLTGLMPDDVRKKNAEASKYWHDDVKIFWVGSILGLTTRAAVEGGANQAVKVEINLYSLNKWVSEEREEPTVSELAGLGEQVIKVMEKWGIQPTKLTSPAGLYSDLIEKLVPTVYSNPQIIKAANYCLPVMDLEWTQQWDTSAFAPTFRNDLRSAYAFQMRNLPNTDKCRVVFSAHKMVCDWGILRVEKMEAPKFNPLVDVKRDKFTTEELACVKRHGGTYTVLDGFYFFFQKPFDYPYRGIVDELWAERRNTSSGIEVLPETAKRTANGIGGKLTQQNQDGEKGKLYNPVLATMMKSRVRLAVADFVEVNHIEKELVKVHVDSVESYTDLGLPQDCGMGEWRQVRE